MSSLKQIHRAFLVAILFSLSFSFPRPAYPGVRDVDEKIHTQKNALQEVRKNIDRKKKILHAFERKEKGLLSRLDSLDKKLALKEEQLESYEQTMQKAQQEKEQLESEIEDLKEDMTRFQDYLSFKVVQLYKYGGYSYVKALFSAGSYADLLRRYRYLQIMARQDAANIESYRKVYADLTARQEGVSDREEKILALQKAFREKNKEVLAEREDRAQLLQKIRLEKAAQQELLEELEQSSQSLQAVIDDLIRQRESLFGDFEKFKGRLSWPVPGTVVTSFGKQKHEKYDTYIFSKGIDIEAGQGSAVHAVYKGTVLFADWFKGYGQMLILDHGKGFYSLYAHLSEILVPVKSDVREGETVGRVGDTGSLRGPVLYFEIRYHGEPQDPLVWLARR